MSRRTGAPGSRADRLHVALLALQSAGVVTDWYCQTQMPGRRWVIWGPGFAERALGTREAERFVGELGASL